MSSGSWAVAGGGGVTTGHSKLDMNMFQMREFSPARPQDEETEILENCHRLTQLLFVCKQSEKRPTKSQLIPPLAHQ